MSLYDGIMDDKSASKQPIALVPSSTSASNWNTGIDLLKAQLKAKRLSNQGDRFNMARQSPVAAPVIDFASRKRTRCLYEGPQISFNSLTGKMEIDMSKMAAGLEVKAASPSYSTPRNARHSSLASAYFDSSLRHALYCPNEYDPLKPNDYEEVKERRRKEAELKRQAQLMANRPAITSESDVNAINMEVISAPLASEDPDDLFIPQVGPAVVSKIMAKMGYREGQGLGKTNQGMSHALSVEKTSRRGGKIVGAEAFSTVATPLPTAEPAEVNESPFGMDILRNPSKVVLLRNMVTHGQVDEDLE